VICWFQAAQIGFAKHAAPIYRSKVAGASRPGGERSRGGVEIPTGGDGERSPQPASARWSNPAGSALRREGYRGGPRLCADDWKFAQIAAGNAV